jgi:hypothetical protein
VFRFMLFGQRHEMGLGPTHTVPPQQAREEAEDCRMLLRKGINPIVHRRAERDANHPAAPVAGVKGITFVAVSEAYIELHRARAGSNGGCCSRGAGPRDRCRHDALLHRD